MPAKRSSGTHRPLAHTTTEVPRFGSEQMPRSWCHISEINLSYPHGSSDMNGGEGWAEQKRYEVPCIVTLA